MSECKDELQNILNTCRSKTDFAEKLGYKFYNGRISKLIDKVILDNELDAKHLVKVLRKRKYELIVKKCPICGKDFETKSGDKKEKTTCSISCANTFFYELRYNEKSNKKRSEKLINHECNKYLSEKSIKECFVCNKSFILGKRKKQKCCSRECGYKLSAQKTRERVANGVHKGWASRSKVKKSFPEEYTIAILDSLNIKYKNELPCGRWFIDFADPIRKLAFEVDGKQHELEERKISDAAKDKYLTENGWTVKRYKWKRIKTLEERNNYINILEEFFK